MSEPPPGYRPLHELRQPKEGGFGKALGEVFFRREEAGLSLAVLLGPEHMNGLGRSHGGMIATLTDFTFGCSIVAGGHAPHGMATVNLELNYLDATHIGDWLECRATLNRTGRSLVFGTAIAQSGGRKIATASAIFTIFKPRS